MASVIDSVWHYKFYLKWNNDAHISATNCLVYVRVETWESTLLGDLISYLQWSSGYVSLLVQWAPYIGHWGIKGSGRNWPSPVLMLYIINNYDISDYLIYLLFIYISFIYVFFFSKFWQFEKNIKFMGFYFVFGLVVVVVVHNIVRICFRGYIWK